MVFVGLLLYEFMDLGKLREWDNLFYHLLRSFLLIVKILIYSF